MKTIKGMSPKRFALHVRDVLVKAGIEPGTYMKQVEVFRMLRPMFNGANPRADRLTSDSEELQEAYQNAGVRWKTHKGFLSFTLIGRETKITTNTKIFSPTHAGFVNEDDQLVVFSRSDGKRPEGLVNGEKRMPGDIFFWDKRTNERYRATLELDNGVE